MTLITEIAFAAIHDFIDELLHPSGTASHLGSDKDIFRLRLIVLRAFENFRAADFWGPIDALEFECRHGRLPPIAHRQEFYKRLGRKGIPTNSLFERAPFSQRSAVISHTAGVAPLPLKVPNEINKIRHKQDQYSYQNAEPKHTCVVTFKSFQTFQPFNSFTGN